MQRRFKSIDEDSEGDDGWMESLVNWKEKRRKSLHTSLPRLAIVDEQRSKDEEREVAHSMAETRARNGRLRQRLKQRAKSVGQMSSGNPLNFQEDYDDGDADDVDDDVWRPPTPPPTRLRTPSPPPFQPQPQQQLTPPPPPKAQPPPTTRHAPQPAMSARDRLFLNGGSEKPFPQMIKSRSTDALDAVEDDDNNNSNNRGRQRQWSPPRQSVRNSGGSRQQLQQRRQRRIEEVVALRARPDFIGSAASLEQLGLRLADSKEDGGGVVRVDWVAVGGQADLCGLRRDDVILTVDDRPTFAAKASAVRGDIERNLVAAAAAASSGGAGGRQVRQVRLRVRRLPSDEVAEEIDFRFNTGSSPQKPQQQHQQQPQQQQQQQKVSDVAVPRSEFRPLASSQFGPSSFTTTSTAGAATTTSQKRGGGGGGLGGDSGVGGQVKHVPMRAVNNPSMFSPEQASLMRKSLPDSGAPGAGREIFRANGIEEKIQQQHHSIQHSMPAPQSQQLQQQQPQQQLGSSGGPVMQKILQNRALLEQHEEQRNNRILRKQQTKQRSRSAERKSVEAGDRPLPIQQPPPLPSTIPATSQEIPVVVKDTRLRLAPSANISGSQVVKQQQQQQQRVPQTLLHHSAAAQHQQHPQGHPAPTRNATAPPPLPPRGFPGVGDIGGSGGVFGGGGSSGGGGGGGRIRAADASNGGKASNGAGRHPGASQPPVSSRQLCSHCGLELGSGAAMAIETLHLYYHVKCFRCCVCDTPLGNGSQGADVRVRREKLHCPRCFSSDEVPR